MENAERYFALCGKVVDATFELLAEMITLEQGLTIEGVGTFGAHERKGSNREVPNEKGVLAQKNLSIFFYLTAEIKTEVSMEVKHCIKALSV